MTDGQRSPVRLEMGYSVTEFSRVLPLAMRDWPVDGCPPRWQVSDEAGHRLADIEITPRSERALGALRLPVLSVRIGFVSATSEQVDELLRRFERGFHRGGG